MPTLAEAIRRLQWSFLNGPQPHRVFDTVLPDLLRLTGSEHGFVGEAWRDEPDAPYLKVFTLSDIDWDAVSRDQYAREYSPGIKLRHLGTTVGEAMVSGEPVFAADETADLRGDGLPPWRTPVHSFVAVPLNYAGEVMGMVGLANRAGGYTAAWLAEFEPLFEAMASIVAAVQFDRRRRSVEALPTGSDQRWLEQLDLVGLAMAKVGPEGYFIDVSPRMCKLVGRTREELLRLTVADISHPDDWPKNYELFKKLLSRELDHHAMQKRYVRPDGTVVWVMMSAGVVFDAEGRFQHSVGVVLDIDQLKRYEEMAVAAEAASRANAAKTEFLSRMSHELRTPLNAVLGFAQLLATDPHSPLTEGQRARVAHIEHAGQHLLAMIGDVLDLSRIEGGSLPLALQPVAVQRLIEESIALVTTTARAARVRLLQAGAAPEASLHLRADPMRLRQVMVNLLSNAIKYNRPGGQVTVEVEVERAASESAEPGRVRIAVTDTGTGLTPLQQTHLFEPFNRLGAERSEIEGTGLGLAITLRLVELMAGTITVVSELGRGSTFTIDLPLDDAHEPAAAPAATDEHEPPDAIAEMEVLYAEDNELNVELVRQLLAMRAGYKLRVARSGREVIAAARSAPPDLLLIDMHLGDMNGVQVLDALRDDLALRAVPRIVLSADALPQTIERARAAGFEVYLTKPVDIGELLRCLDRYRSRQRGD
jgi:PAS domain S-box-containing protein